MWATGYRVTIPFLPARLVGADPERLPLYKRVFHLDDPSLAFVGLMQSTGAALPIVEAQAEAGRRLLRRRVRAAPAGSGGAPSPATCAPRGRGGATGVP